MATESIKYLSPDTDNKTETKVFPRPDQHAKGIVNWLTTIDHKKIGIMYGGRMVEFGKSFDIYKNPKHPYTKALLQSIPSIKNKSKPSYIEGSPPNLVNPKSGCMFFDRCPDAMEKCKNDPPRFKTNSGYVECWLYDEESNTI